MHRHFPLSVYYARSKRPISTSALTRFPDPEFPIPRRMRYARPMSGKKIHKLNRYPDTLAYRLLLTVLAVLMMGMTSRLLAHGSVVAEGDNCLIQFDFYSAHFTVFQPRTRLHNTFCEDIPDVDESVFVMEYLHNSLREVPVDFRLVRNTTTLGRFVKWTDLEAMGDLGNITEFHQNFPPQPDGVLRVMHRFEQPGDYIGIVSAPHPSLDLVYYAVFPFRVGRSALDYWPWTLPLLAAVGLVLYRRQRLQPHLPRDEQS